jgi:hypothetical protein
MPEPSVFSNKYFAMQNDCVSSEGQEIGLSRALFDGGHPVPSAVCLSCRRTMRAFLKAKRGNFLTPRLTVFAEQWEYPRPVG